jgi:hypothetical protein
MPETEEMIALRGSTEESIKAIDDKLKEIEKNMKLKTDTDEEPITPDPTTKKPVSKEYQEFIDAQAKFLKEKQEFDAQRREILLEPFSKEEREVYKELTISELNLIINDRKQRQYGTFLTEPPIDDDSVYKEDVTIWDVTLKKNVFHPKGSKKE